MSKYENMPDEQLIRKLREGEAAIMDYIISKYKHVSIPFCNYHPPLKPPPEENPPPKPVPKVELCVE